MDREAVVRAAEQYIGVPFQHQGRTKNGVDCIGLILRAYWDAGHCPHEFRQYGKAPRPSTMRSELLKDGRVLSKHECILPADVIWFRIRTHPQHLALWTGRDIIHSFSRMGKVVRHPLTQEWIGKIENRLRYRVFDE